MKQKILTGWYKIKSQSNCQSITLTDWPKGGNIMNDLLKPTVQTATGLNVTSTQNLERTRLAPRYSNKRGRPSSIPLTIPSLSPDTHLLLDKTSDATRGLSYAKWTTWAGC